jgi:hypothetical protein
MNEESRTAYLIELKGSDIRGALEQLIHTESKLKSRLRDYITKFRIVASKCRTHEIHDASFNRYRIKHKGKLEFRANVYEEDI